MTLNDVSTGETIAYNIDDTPTRCAHTETMSGIATRCDRITGHSGPHRVTATWVNGQFL